MHHSLQEWEKAERERSALEATQTIADDSLASPKNVKRYLNPPSDTVHPLEYACYLLGDVRGKTILEYGCGDGVNTVLLANRGARVISLDLSPELIDVARKRLLAHGIASGVDLIVGSAHNLPIPDESIDVVFGIAILHHLDLALSAREVRRVLKPSGKAIFQEPVRNSALIRAVRKLIPYRSPDVSPFERPLTDHELEDFAQGYASFRARSFTLPTSSIFQIVAPLRRYASASLHWDARLLRAFPPLAYFSSVKVIQMTR
jgi:SAM-dependent methyltransferase